MHTSYICAELLEDGPEHGKGGDVLSHLSVSVCAF